MDRLNDDRPKEKRQPVLDWRFECSEIYRQPQLRAQQMSNRCDEAILPRQLRDGSAICFGCAREVGRADTCARFTISRLDDLGIRGGDAGHRRHDYRRQNSRPKQPKSP